MYLLLFSVLRIRFTCLFFLEGVIIEFRLLSCEQDHVEGYLELSAKTKTYFATATAQWDADFYVKVDDDVHVNIGNKFDLAFHIQI